MKEFNSKKKIEDVDDFESYCIDLFECFLDTFTKENGLIRDIEEGDTSDDSIQFAYTWKGQRLAEKMLRLLNEIAVAHYPNDEYIDISSVKFQEIS